MQAPVAMVGNDWHALPPRGAWFAAINGAIGGFFPFAATGFLSLATHFGSPWLLIPAAGAMGALFGAWLGWKRHRRTAWRLDDTGFAVRRGRLWHTETRVPTSRVQHLDLKRGPLERMAKLATLVVHTAGTRMAAVSVSGLDDADAEYLRDQLARQIDHDGDAL
ncbi:MAG: PH domain-containing protein [Pseudoxanthomonas sp.]